MIQEGSLLTGVLVGAGGFIGAALRYRIGLIPIKGNDAFPFKTLFINVAGAFMIGIITALAERKNINPNLVLMLQVGVCGGFTTFSTFAYETSGLMKNGNTAQAVIYAVLSVVLCVLAVFAAQAAIKAVMSR